MRKFLCVMLAVLLALTALPTLAMDGDGQLTIEALDMNVLYAFEDGGQLLVVGEEGALFSWKMGEASATRLTCELPELEENETDAVFPFAADGRLYAIRLVTETEDGEKDFGHTALYELTLEDGTLRGEKLDKLDWDDLVIYSDDDAEARIPRLVVGDGDRAWVLCENNYGEESTSTLARLDIEDCELEVLDDPADIQNVVPYKDGKLLMLQRGFFSEENTLLLYDPEEEAYEEMCTFPVDLLSPVIGLAYDADTDRVFITRDGEVCPVDLEAGEIGAGIVDIPLSTDYSRDGAFITGGVYVAFNTEIVSRALYDRPEITARLVINDPLAATPVEAAIKRFNAAHDTARATLSRNLNAQDQIAERMMQQDSGIDIYVLDTAMPTYDVVYNRGFLMPLNDSPVVADLVGQMYPGIQKAITREGKIQALPVMAFASALGVSEKALNTLGLTLDDIPGDWESFLDFLPTLAEPLAEHPEVKLMEIMEKVSDARLGWLAVIFNEYHHYTTSEGLDKGFNEEPLRTLLDKLSAVDFEALGLAPTDEDVDDSLGERQPLFDFAASCMLGNFCLPEYVPVHLTLTPEIPEYMVLECMMIGVNPYTEHPDLALEFIGDVVECMPVSLRAALVPTMNEPVRGAYNERKIEEQRETVAQLEAQLEEADGANRQLAESELEKAREKLRDLEDNAWDVGPVELEWYRAHDDRLMPAGVNWLNNDYAAENFNYIMQYCAGELSAEEMLSGMDKTTEMIRREGN